MKPGTDEAQAFEALRPKLLRIACVSKLPPLQFALARKLAELDN